MMIRQQAEHILDAYIAMEQPYSNYDDAKAALREVILDAMTSYTVSNAGSITRPGSNWYIPTDWNRGTVVTCGGDEK